MRQPDCSLGGVTFGRLDRAAFVRPVAHRGLHDASAGIIENSGGAFAAAAAAGYGIECDVRAAADGTPIVFHDARLERLVEGRGELAAIGLPEVRRLRYRIGGERPITLGELLEIVDGRVPVLVEVKSEWAAPVAGFLEAVAGACRGYRGPVAVMSFDPAILAGLRALAPGVPRGIVSGLYGRDAHWWCDRLSEERAFALSHLLELGGVEPAFVAYDARALPTPVTRFVREVVGLVLFTWTVRSTADAVRVRPFADAPIFEGYRPAG